MSRKIKEIIKKLDEHLKNELEKLPTNEELDGFYRFCMEHLVHPDQLFFFPEYWFYDDVLSLLREDDVVFDVGAGDLRFSLLASLKVRKVYAVEVNPIILAPALKIIGYDLPNNVIPICANAFEMELPRDVTVVTCLMIRRIDAFPREWVKQARIIFTERDGIYMIEDGRIKVVKKLPK